MILWSLYWEFSVWEFSVILLCGFCALCIGNFLFAGIGCVDYVVSILGIFCFGIFCYFVVWILCSLYWEFSVCRNWLCGLCGLCIGNFLFAGICCLDSVVSIICAGKFLCFVVSVICCVVQNQSYVWVVTVNCCVAQNHTL